MTDAKQPITGRHALYLLLSLSAVGAPHAAHLPWWTVGLVAMLLAWRAYVGYARRALPNRWLLLLTALAATVGVFLSYRTIFGREAGVALLVIMLALKTLEMRTLRDAMLLIFLGYFLVMTNLLYSQSIATGLYMLACTVFITATMIGLNYADDEPPFRVQLRTAGLMLAQSVPLMVALFLLFPRVPGPLWGMPRDAFAGVTGLSDTMSPGGISSLVLSDAVAFRVSFESPLPRTRDLYWRGPLMWDFDGRTWSVQFFLHTAPRIEASGEPVKYEVTLEPHNRRWMFALDLPAVVPAGAVVSADYHLYAVRPVNNRVRYEMTSLLNASFGGVEDQRALNRALHLPARSNPRAQALGRSLREKHGGNHAAIANEMLALFRGQEFRYTLEPPLLPGQHPVDEFLFSTRAGFCEHYASAFAVVMRAAQVPARIVTGYQGGDYSALGSYMIVRQADAHAWTEIWLKDRGWVRVDPTSAVSPLRVDTGISAAVPRNESLPLLVRGDAAFLRQLRLTWDYLTNTWNQWVLGYTPERQRWLLSNVGVDNATWENLAAILFCLAGVIVALLTALALRQLRSRVRDPVKIAYLKFCDKLRRTGLPRAAAEGPVDYALRIGGLRPDLTPAVEGITALYVALRYGAEKSATALLDLQQRVRQFSA
jgi:transglutaminase-like putative cysteine protease